MMEAEAGRLENDREIPRLQAVIDNPNSTPREVEAANVALDDKLANYDFLLDDYVRGSEGWYRLFERLDREPADSSIMDR